MEAGPTPTPALLVRVVEDKLAAEFIFNIVHLRADQRHNCLAVNDNLDACFFDHFVKFLDLLLPDVVHRVGKTITALLRQTDLETDLLNNHRTRF